jgi:hypothetical protein
MNPVPADPPMQPAPRFPWRGLLLWLRDTAKLIWPTSLSGRLLLIFPVLAGLFYLGVMLWLSGAFEPQAFPEIPSYEEPPAGEAFAMAVFGVAISVYNLLPAAALAVLISLTSRRFAKGMPVVAVGCLAFCAGLVYVLLDMVWSESSTAAILLLFLPIPLGVLVLVFGLLAVLMHFVRFRYAHRT